MSKEKLEAKLKAMKSRRKELGNLVASIRTEYKQLSNKIAGLQGKIISIDETLPALDLSIKRIERQIKNEG